ncbi:MAG: ATPase P [Firmicutes bacterium]|jgi:hypothetical protein|nr:ATPase P [Bacillota bacterium]
MIFAPKRVGNLTLDPISLKEDRRSCEKIGPCGLGKQALYLNSFFMDRRFYCVWTDVRRVFKRVAMSKGGYTGKGLFGSLPYLVVQLSNGREISCNFKFEEDVDRLLVAVQRSHPDIPIHSKEAEKRLEKARREEEARYLKELSPEAQGAVDSLGRARDYLEKKPEIGEELSACAKQKRAIDGVKRGNLLMAVGILLVSIALLAAGLIFLARGEKSWPLYFVLFGFAGMLFVAGAGILPTGRRNKKTVQRDWDLALSNAKAYTDAYPDFPVPPQYAHPVVLTRMIRILREGRAQTAAEAFDKMKEDLKGLDHTKTVSQEEYDEIVAVKPMFRVMQYQ